MVEYVLQMRRWIGDEWEHKAGVQEVEQCQAEGGSDDGCICQERETYLAAAQKLPIAEFLVGWDTRDGIDKSCSCSYRDNKDADEAG